MAKRHRGLLSFATFDDLENYGVDFLVTPEWNGSLREELVAWLLAQYQRTFSIRLADVRADSSTVDAVRSSQNVHCHHDERRRASYLELQQLPEDILRLFSQNFRKNLRKQEARLHSLADVQFIFVAGGDAQPEHFDQFVELEASGWKGKAGTAITSLNATLGYYRDLVAGLTDDGQTEWHFLMAENRVIGAHFGVRIRQVLNLIKIAYDESYAPYGPGNMLFLEMLRRESVQQLSREIDCLTDMPWHVNWRMSRRSYVTITLFPQTAVPVVLGYLPAITADALRRSKALRGIVRAVRRWWRRSGQADG